MTYDVVAVSIATGRVRLIADDLTEPNADAVVRMAIARRGVENEYYIVVPHGTYKDGDLAVWREGARP